MKKTAFFLIGMLLLASNASAGETIGVAVSIAPLAEFVEAIGGDHVAVTVMVPPGASPHTYEPTPGQLKAVSRARLYVKVGSGIEFERVWLDKILAVNRHLAVCDASRNVAFIATEGHPHQHQPSSLQAAKDPHIWTSPANAMKMVENICDGLIGVNPANEALYRANAEVYQEKLRGLKSRITKGLSGVQHRKFMVFHAAWGYFAHEFSLEQMAVETGGKEPSARDLARLISKAKAQNIRVIFTEPQFNSKSAETIAHAIGAKVIAIDPLARHYLQNMEGMAHAVTESMK